MVLLEPVDTVADQAALPMVSNMHVNEAARGCRPSAVAVAVLLFTTVNWLASDRNRNPVCSSGMWTIGRCRW